MSNWLQGICVCLLIGLTDSAVAEQGPVEMLQATTDQVLAVVREDPEVLDDPDRVRILADELVLPHVDFEAMSRWVLGKYWRQATPQQRNAFVDAFREMLLSSYLRSMTSYRDNTVTFQPLRTPVEGGKVKVHAGIIQPGGPTVQVMFRLHKPGDEWLIYDVVVEGVSLVATHRSSISQEVRNSGIDGLIAIMQERNSVAAAQAAQAETAASTAE